MPAKKILIADDDVALLKALTTRLESEGYEVVTSQDGYQALDFARRHKPDLIVLDIHMPAGSGFSVQERMANIKEIARTRVIYITGDPPGKVDYNAKDLGAFSVVHKPFTTKHLLNTIRAALGEFDEEHLGAWSA